MTRTLKATYKRGMLRLDQPIPLNDGARVDVIVISRDEERVEPSPDAENRSWEALTQLLRECAIDTGIPDLAHQHDHYLYGTPKK